MSDPIPSPEPPKASEGAKNILTKKIGPLSVGWYLIAFLGMLVIYYVWKKRSTSGGTNVVPTAFTGDGGPSGNGIAGASGGNAASGIGGYTGAVTGPSGGTSATTLGQWAANAANYLTGVGQDAVAVQTALAAYISGEQLTPAQQNIISQAITAEGSPPGGVVTANTSAQTVGYTVQSGDSLTSIAQAFYGDATRWRDIYAANVSVFPTGANLSTPLHSGMTLKLPGTGLSPTPGARDSYSGVPAGHKYTLQFGDTLIQLSERFYGNPGSWPKIVAANPGLITDVNHPPVGTTITIPS